MLFRQFAIGALVGFAISGAILGFAATASAAGDPTKGEEVYSRCQGCHSIDTNRIGPMHKCLFGRKAGSIAGFNYSKAMRESGITWDETNFDKFITSPRAAVPGTRMPFAGIPDATDRANLIAYLKTFSGPAAGCPQ
jgi:cytochrome c